MYVIIIGTYPLVLFCPFDVSPDDGTNAPSQSRLGCSPAASPVELDIFQGSWGLIARFNLPIGSPRIG